MGKYAEMARDLSKKRQESSKASGMKDALDQAKVAAKATRNPFILIKKIEIGKDWPYFLAFFAAILKDIFDFLEIILPGIGAVMAFLCGVFIFFMMLLVGNASKKGFKQKIARYITLLIATGLEIIIGLDWVPWETVGVIVIYGMLLVERKAHENKN